MHRDKALTWLLAIAGLGGCGGMLAPPDAGNGGTLSLDAGLGADAASIDLGAGGHIMLPDAAAERSACDSWNFQAPATPIAGTPCAYAVPEPVCDYADKEHIGILIDGTEIPRDTSHANGWDYLDVMGDVEIFGPICDAIQAGAVAAVSVVYRVILP